MAATIAHASASTAMILKMAGVDAGMTGVMDVMDCEDCAADEATGSACDPGCVTTPPAVAPQLGEVSSPDAHERFADVLIRASGQAFAPELLPPRAIILT